MENLIDGLGYDTSKDQFFTNTYAWQYIMPNTKKSQTFIGKSGITKYDVNTAMGEAAPTRGKQFNQRALWGYDSDRKYLKKGITIEQASEIVKKMDYFFKEDMIEIGWNLRHNKNSRELGTEFYEGPTNVWLETIKQKWNEAFIKSNQLVIGEFEGQDLGDMSVMGSQGVVTEQINEVLHTHKKVRAIIPCGYGKGFLEFRGAYKFDKAKNSKIIVYYCHNIPATKQLSVKHAEYADGTIYQGTMSRYVVCSEKKYVKGQANFGIENYSATDGKLKEVIQEAILSKQRTAFYVNNKSAGEFNDTFRLIANQLRYTKKPFVFIDEEQEFCGHISSSKTDAILNSIASYQVSFTATERRRGTDTNKDRIYNDDIKHFGHIAIEITPSETISEGRSCPIHFKTVEVSENHQLMRQIGVNGIIESVFGDETSAAVRGRMLRAIVCLVKSIREEDKSHILLVTSLIVDTESAIILVNKLIEHQIIPNDYVVIRSLRQDGLDSTKRFNSLEKGILIGTPWLVTGIDAPNIDALVPTYDMGSEITATQFIGRGQRPVDDKELSVYIPIDPSETFIPSMLRVANNFILGENSHNIGRNTILEEGEEILGSIQRRRITSDIDREVNMNSAYRNYWDNIYNDLTTNEIGSARGYLLTEWLPFEEAREYVRGVGLKNSEEYYEWEKTDRPDNIPSNPMKIYENSGWVDIGDYIGTFNKWWGNVEWRNFIDAREYVRGLGLKSEKTDWRRVTKEKWFPSDIPASPWNVYENEYLSMGDWLGTKPGYMGNGKYKPFEEAREYVRGLSLKSQMEYAKWSNSNQRNYGVPGNPRKIYLNDGWLGWGDFLGTKIGFTGKYKSKEEVIDYIVSLGVKSNKEWRLIKKTEGFKLPVDVPAEPDNVYEDWSWTFVSGRFGLKGGRNRIPLKDDDKWSFEKCKKYAQGLKLKTGREWKNMEHPIGVPRRPDLAYLNDGFTDMMDFLGIKKIVLTKKQILDAQNKFSNITKQAQYSGVSYKEYVKQSIELGVYKKMSAEERNRKIASTRKSSGKQKI